MVQIATSRSRTGRKPTSTSSSDANLDSNSRSETETERRDALLRRYPSVTCLEDSTTTLSVRGWLLCVHGSPCTPLLCPSSRARLPVQPGRAASSKACGASSRSSTSSGTSTPGAECASSRAIRFSSCAPRRGRSPGTSRCAARCPDGHDPGDASSVGGFTSDGVAHAMQEPIVVDVLLPERL